MANRKKIFRTVLWSLLAVFIIIQLFRPEKNNSGDSGNDISTVFPVPDRVKVLLDAACNDCHSNTTKYPWYSYIQPVAWWLDGHIRDGKKRLNLSEFAAYRPNRQFHKLEEIDELVSEKEMPLESYTWAHADAKLSDDQRQVLINWTKDLRDSMRANYPADSLVMPKRK